MKTPVVNSSLSGIEAQRLAGLLRAGAFKGQTLQLETIFPQGVTALDAQGQRVFLPLDLLTTLLKRTGF